MDVGESEPIKVGCTYNSQKDLCYYGPDVTYSPELLDEDTTAAEKTAPPLKSTKGTKRGSKHMAQPKNTLTTGATYHHDEHVSARATKQPARSYKSAIKKTEKAAAVSLERLNTVEADLKASDKVRPSSEEDTTNPSDKVRPSSKEDTTNPFEQSLLDLL